MANNTKAVEYLKPGRLSKTTLGAKAALADLALGTFAGVRSGKSFGSALVQGAGEALAFGMMPGPMMAYYGGMMAGAGVKAGMQAQTRIEGEYRQRVDPNPNFSYRDSQQALTMRQAGIQAIQGSKMNARNALGGEASLMHRSKKIY